MASAWNSASKAVLLTHPQLNTFSRHSKQTLRSGPVFFNAIYRLAVIRIFHNTRILSRQENLPCIAAFDIIEHINPR